MYESGQPVGLVEEVDQNMKENSKNDRNGVIHKNDTI